MNRTRFLATAAAALALAVSVPAFAGTGASSSPYVKTRAEVRAELLQAQRDGTLAHMNATSYTQGMDLVPFSARNYERPARAAR
ncbi:DUF4148 domain-containing protein [Burkholderia guangdongensis]|uniref:DUF4148 domain-containing protein n=1 Tax=Burkholderia guangdongensis TaxID=1792500 RepID=UPI0015CB64D7|nr:DUF4148 domain-containing protein [Burkholderia guangdongensis]